MGIRDAAANVPDAVCFGAGQDDERPRCVGHHAQIELQLAKGREEGSGVLSLGQNDEYGGWHEEEEQGARYHGRDIQGVEGDHAV